MVISNYHGPRSNIIKCCWPEMTGKYIGVTKIQCHQFHIFYNSAIDLCLEWRQTWRWVKHSNLIGYSPPPKKNVLFILKRNLLMIWKFRLLLLEAPNFQRHWKNQLTSEMALNSGHVLIKCTTRIFNLQHFKGRLALEMTPNSAHTLIKYWRLVFDFFKRKKTFIF